MTQSKLCEKESFSSPPPGNSLPSFYKERSAHFFLVCVFIIFDVQLNWKHFLTDLLFITICGSFLLQKISEPLNNLALFGFWRGEELIKHLAPVTHPAKIFFLSWYHSSVFQVVPYSEQPKDLNQWGPGRWDGDNRYPGIGLVFLVQELSDNLATGEVWVSALQLEPVHRGWVGPPTFLCFYRALSSRIQGGLGFGSKDDPLFCLSR